MTEDRTIPKYIVMDKWLPIKERVYSELEYFSKERDTIGLTPGKEYLSSAKLAKKYGVTDSRFDKKDDNCIMCGLCVRVCQQVVGAGTTCFSGRGKDRAVTTPYKELSDVCIG